MLSFLLYLYSIITSRQHIRIKMIAVINPSLFMLSNLVFLCKTPACNHLKSNYFFKYGWFFSKLVF